MRVRARVARAEGQQVGQASVLRNHAAGVHGQHLEGPLGGCLKGTWRGRSGGVDLQEAHWPRARPGMAQPHPLWHRAACTLPTATPPPPPHGSLRAGHPLAALILLRVQRLIPRGRPGRSCSKTNRSAVSPAEILASQIHIQSGRQPASCRGPVGSAGTGTGGPGQLIKDPREQPALIKPCVGLGAG